MGPVQQHTPLVRTKSEAAACVLSRPDLHMSANKEFQIKGIFLFPYAFFVSHKKYCPIDTEEHFVAALCNKLGKSPCHPGRWTAVR